jgi:putative transcriptional regulator
MDDTLLPETGGLAGQLLVAMPQMQDPRFARTVIFMCAHTPEGAMGLVVNRLVHSITFPDLLEQLGSSPPSAETKFACILAGRSNPGGASCCTQPTITAKERCR